MNSCLDELSSHADRITSAFDATIATSSRSLSEYCYGINRIRSKLDDLESIAKLHVEKYSRDCEKQRNDALERIQAGKHHARIYQDLMIAGNAADFTPPDCSFAAGISPDDKCLRVILNHEAVLTSLAASSSEHMFMVDALHSIVSCRERIYRQRPMVTDIPKFMTVKAKTVTNKPVEDLCETDIILQLLDVATDMLLPEYNFQVVMKGPGHCAIRCSLPATFSGAEVRVRLYIKEVELFDSVIQNAHTITGVFGNPVTVNAVQGGIAAHAGNMYRCRDDGYVAINDIASGEIIGDFQLPVTDVRKPIVISPEGYMYVLNIHASAENWNISIFNLNDGNNLLGSIALKRGYHQPIHFDLLGEDLLVVFEDRKVVHMKMDCSGLAARHFVEYDMGYDSGLTSVHLLLNNRGFVAKYGRRQYMMYYPLIPGHPPQRFTNATGSIRCIIPCDEHGKEIAVFSSRAMEVIDVTTGITALTVLMPFKVRTVFGCVSNLYALNISKTLVCTVR